MRPTYSPRRPSPANRNEFALTTNRTKDGHPGTVTNMREITRVTTAARKKIKDEINPKYENIRSGLYEKANIESIESLIILFTEYLVLPAYLFARTIG